MRKEELLKHLDDHLVDHLDTFILDYCLDDH